MLNFKIRDYEDFKFLFGLEIHGNGVKSRKNKILLQHLKNPALIRWCRNNNDWSLLHIRSMAELKHLVLSYIRETGKADINLPNKVRLIGNTYWSSQYRTDHMEVVFFKEEETGCHGSSHAEMRFFDDCRFVIQCDRRGNSDLITNIGCTDLCSEKFIQDIAPEHWGYKEGTGMMTDVEALKEKGLSVSAINISCGYYNPHTDEEITEKRDLEKCWRFVQHIIEDCTETYPHEVGENGYFTNDYLCDLEDEIYSILQQDPTLTGADLYDMYQTNFPMLSHGEFERIVDEFHLMYDCYDEDTTNQTFKPDGKKNNKEEYDF